MARPGSLRPAVGLVGYGKHLAGAGGVMGVLQRCCTVHMGQKPSSTPLGQIPPSVTEGGVIVVGNGSAGFTEARCGSGGVRKALGGRRRGDARQAALLHGAHGSKTRFCTPGSNSSLCDGRWSNCRREWLGQGH
jgi:hypothetical protein